MWPDEAVPARRRRYGCHVLVASRSLRTSIAIPAAQRRRGPGPSAALVEVGPGRAAAALAVAEGLGARGEPRPPLGRIAVGRLGTGPGAATTAPYDIGMVPTNAPLHRTVLTKS